MNSEHRDRFWGVGELKGFGQHVGKEYGKTGRRMSGAAAGPKDQEGLAGTCACVGYLCPDLSLTWCTAARAFRESGAHCVGQRSPGLNLSCARPTMVVIKDAPTRGEYRGWRVQCVYVSMCVVGRVVGQGGKEACVTPVKPVCGIA